MSAFSWRDWGKSRGTSISIADLRIKMFTLLYSEVPVSVSIITTKTKLLAVVARMWTPRGPPVDIVKTKVRARRGLAPLLQPLLHVLWRNLFWRRSLCTLWLACNSYSSPYYIVQWYTTSTSRATCGSFLYWIYTRVILNIFDMHTVIPDNNYFQYF
jgi:hypothetical protein